MMRTKMSPRFRVGEHNEEPSRTKQSFKAVCDINNILEKFQRTGVIEHVRRHGPDYGFAPAVDYKEAMDIVARGKSMFEELPSSLRKRFKTPEAFLEFVQDPENGEEMVELGLATRRQAAEADAVAVQPTLGADESAGEGVQPE